VSLSGNGKKFLFMFMVRGGLNDAKTFIYQGLETIAGFLLSSTLL